ncbi:F0F1 ATP synthase subunit A [Maribacter sp. ACAM166]|uniref:F0F1 ATP synthase subunit A n=1 Tax=Maribacter sp. ACAM166 TaxID=2508996 RepID=UPI0010FCFEF7|nr:F0F1 ATP synthase subunit A [Maribacter sp. ACAM166]TLP72850.1 F0F1 ATP synthase subunit A [Maribacter sp. ACAM166]
MRVSPDQMVFWEYGFITINLTIVTTWALMFLLVFGAWLITRKLKSDIETSRWQNVLEMLVLMIRNQIKEVGLSKPDKYMGFIGTLFLFIAVSNLLIILPWYEAPTGSLSTTAALAISVFIAVPFFGIAEGGLKRYLHSYLQPNIIMLPFNIISEISRTLALAVRLFGNIMSGGLIATVLISIVPFFFPMVMSALGMLTGMIQAYIFAILATVYIAAATEDTQRKKHKEIPLEVNEKQI